ncbi:MAG: tetratricopeptide repeat protein, partial [Chitinophagaceae bacterium]
MKKTFITFLVAGLLLVSAIQAQSIQDGVKDLYAERFKSAKATFEKLLAANPNNIEATYWLGQTHIEMEDTSGAKKVYEKALLASANAPLVIVGMGQIDLMQNKVSEARQRFETAITMTKGKKGNDAVILNAVGRAITKVYNDKTKIGDINYAISKLEEASQQKIKEEGLSADIYLNLGDAYRKAKPGEAGGLAYQNYQKAIDVSPGFAVPHHRMAHLFNSQRNWDLYEKYLNDAITKDPKFAPAYYELSYYNMLRKDQNLDAAKKYAQQFKQ